MINVNIPQMKQMIRLIGVAKRRPLYFHGPSGVGKSEGIEQTCQELDGVMVDIRVSQYESVDFRGIPDIQANTTVWNMPATLPFKGNPKFEMAGDSGKPIFLFLDEINQGDPSVLSVLYQLIHNRRVGEHELLDNVVIICAGNRDKDRGTTTKFPAPLANRMTHAELAPDVKAWSDWAAKAGVSPVLIGFLNFRSELLHTFDPANPVTVFATPRTWVDVNEDFTDTDLPEDIRIASIAGTVGEGPGTELQAFSELMDTLVPIEQIINDPENVPVPNELDKQWAMATHVAGNMSKDTCDQLHKYLARMEAEMTVMAWTLAINRDDSVTDSNAFLYGYAPQYRSMFTS